MKMRDSMTEQIEKIHECGTDIIRLADSLKDLLNLEEYSYPAFTDVRHRMTLLSQAGFSKEVKSLIEKHGAEKLSDIDPSDYESLLKEAESIGGQVTDNA